MRGWDARRVADAAGAELLRSGTVAGDPGPWRASVDSRQLTGGELFFGLAGSREDGGKRATEALQSGAWGVLVAPEQARLAMSASHEGTVIAHADPLSALQALAHAWREELGRRGASVVAVTGSTGKTSTKDILTALLGAHLPSASSPANLNTEIGLPLAILAAPETTRALVLEMAMRGPGQIAELTAIADPDVGVIVNIGPAHLELLGSLTAIAAAKAELITGMRTGAAIVVPAGETLLTPHLREDLRTLTFGEGGDVSLLGLDAGRVFLGHEGERIELRPSFGQPHNVRNLLAAVAVARVLGYTPSGTLDVEFSAMRGERSTLPGEVVLIDDCYNANPMSMRAAIEDLATIGGGRRVAVLGEMLELGRQGPHLHREAGRQAREAGVELLVTVGALAGAIAGGFGAGARSLPDAATAAEQVPGLVRDGDVVLVKGSRGVGLERVTAALCARRADGRRADLASGAADGRSG